MAYSSIESGIIHLESEMNWSNVTSFMVILREMESHPEVKAITLHITGIGGTTLAATAIAQAVRNCSKPVRTVGSGYLASSAVLVLAAGHSQSRVLLDGTLLMLHAPRVPRPELDSMTLTAMREFTKGLEMKVAHYYAELARVTKKPVEFWLETLADDRPDWFFSPEEAITLGLADQIITR